MLSVLNRIDYRMICLVMACLVYAALGSPTPNSLSFSEILIGVLLICAVGIVQARQALIGSFGGAAFFWQVAGRVFLLYGIIFGSVNSILYGNPVLDTVRDIIPFLFLFLPLLMKDLIVAKELHGRLLVFCAIFIGVLFSVRSLLMQDIHKCWIWCTPELLYLENMPTVLFAALFLSGSALSLLIRENKPASMLCALGLLLLSAVPFAAMASVHQRASLGAGLLYYMIILVFFFREQPKRVFMVLSGLFVLAAMTGFSPGDLAGKLGEKTQVVGLNMRPQELWAVWHVVTGDPVTFLFGIGWGGHFHSPAVGGVSVNFTHNFFSGILLKIGFCGIVLGCFYILGLLQKLFQVMSGDPVLGIAIAAPVLIDLTLYASYKSLDFGLMLLMISGTVVYLRSSRTESFVAERKCADPL